MWVADGGESVRVYCLDRAAPCHRAERRVSTDATNSWRYAADDITLPTANRHSGGLWSDDSYVWVVDPIDDKVYRYALPYDATTDPDEYGLAAANGPGRTSVVRRRHHVGVRK